MDGVDDGIVDGIIDGIVEILGAMDGAMDGYVQDGIHTMNSKSSSVVSNLSNSVS